MNQKGRAWIELDLHNLHHNVEELRKAAGAGCELMPAVKANAYGHGAVPVSRALAGDGITSFCVASLGEGIELREAGIRGMILILGYTSPADFPELLNYNLTQTVVDAACAEDLDRCGRKLGQRIPVHVGIDTGMHRLGERSSDLERILPLWEMDGIRIDGVFSHLCVSDGITERERAFTMEQIRKFREVVEKIHSAGKSGFKTHLQGSYGILNYPGAGFDFARPGIALYGAYSLPEDEKNTVFPADLRPVLSLKARVETVKMLRAGESAGYGLTYTAPSDRKIAVVSAGYADGVPRNLSNCGHALVKGQKVPVVGRICMDQLTLDVTEVRNVFPGDEAVLIGRSGSREISAAEMAQAAGTISNEILSRLGSRPERITFTQI